MRATKRFDRDLMRRLRKGNAMTLRELSEMTGLSNPFLSQLETGRCSPSLDAAVAIAEAFGLNVDTLVLPRPTRKRHAR